MHKGILWIALPFAWRQSDHRIVAGSLWALALFWGGVLGDGALGWGLGDGDPAPCHKFAGFFPKSPEIFFTNAPDMFGVGGQLPNAASNAAGNRIDVRMSMAALGHGVWPWPWALFWP